VAAHGLAHEAGEQGLAARQGEDACRPPVEVRDPVVLDEQADPVLA
jgi:hypothetical protein